MLSTRAVASSLRLSLRVGSSTLRLQLPTLPAFFGSSSSSSLTPALAGLSNAAESSGTETKEGGLGALWDGILLAVPKKKVSHSRKSMRAANKGLKDRADMVHCSACGKPKIQHHICAHCYFELNRARKIALAQQDASQIVNAKSPTQQKSLNNQ